VSLAEWQPELPKMNGGDELLSGASSPDLAHHGVLDEGVRFLQKPFSVEMLATKLREVLQ
jgi:hypothetical protein